jgi:predicted transposase/invertase (TIGR01784 family)
MTISRDEIERARLLSEYKYELDTQSRIAYAHQDGVKEGRKEGEQTGRKNGILEVARNLKSFGIATDQITRATGLSYDVIAKL